MLIENNEGLANLATKLMYGIYLYSFPRGRKINMKNH